MIGNGKQQITIHIPYTLSLKYLSSLKSRYPWSCTKINSLFLIFSLASLLLSSVLTFLFVSFVPFSLFCPHSKSESLDLFLPYAKASAFGTSLRQHLLSIFYVWPYCLNEFHSAAFVGKSYDLSLPIGMRVPCYSAKPIISTNVAIAKMTQERNYELQNRLIA